MSRMVVTDDCHRLGIYKVSVLEKADICLLTSIRRLHKNKNVTTSFEFRHEIISISISHALVYTYSTSLAIAID